MALQRPIKANKTPMPNTHKSIEEYAKEFETKFSYGGFGGLMPQHRDGGATLMREVKEYISTALQSFAQQQVQEAQANCLCKDKGVIEMIEEARRETVEEIRQAIRAKTFWNSLDVEITLDNLSTLQSKRLEDKKEI